MLSNTSTIISIESGSVRYFIMTDIVAEAQSPRVRAGLEPLRRIITVDPIHIALAMITGAVITYALFALGVAKVPVGGLEIETTGIVAAGVFLTFAGWFRLVRESK